MLGPVSWNHYRDTEYDTDFNRPMNLGQTVGIGWMDELNGREMVITMHRTRGSHPFTEADASTLRLIRPLFSRVWNLSRENDILRRECYYPAELDVGTDILSSREAEVAHLLLHRISMREIAGRLGISPRTVERHALHIYRKLDVANRRELVRRLSESPSPLIREYG
jgi:DNA-binding CsgD family transcriptional regulator